MSDVQPASVDRSGTPLGIGIGIGIGSTGAVSVTGGPNGGGGGGGDGLMLVDTPSLYFRSFFGVPRSVRAPDGTPVGAVRGLLDVLARQIVTVRPRRMVTCFDADWRPAFRVALLASYKAHRVARPADGDGPGGPTGAGGLVASAGGPAAGQPDSGRPDSGRGDGGPGDVEQVDADLLVQLPIIDAVLDAFGIARVAAAGFEADDVIATLASRHGGGVDILTGDRDLFQLVDDTAGVRVRYAVERFVVADEASVRARYDIPGRGYADFAVLRGDPSDGLPGVAGIGAKTAAALLNRFGSLSGLLGAVDAGQTVGMTAGVRRRLVDAREYLRVAVAVVAVVRDCPVGPVDDLLPAVPRDAAAVGRLARRFGLVGSCTRLVAAMAQAAAAADGPGSR